jgi:hypothetical protein
MALYPVQTFCVLDQFLFLADRGFFDNRTSTQQGTWFKKDAIDNMRFQFHQTLNLQEQNDATIERR